MERQTSSSYQQLQQRVWREHLLFSVLLELTYQCNLDCFFCYNDTGLKGRPLSLENYRQLLDDLVELGTMNLTLSGGEPLAHPAFFAIGGYARERGFVVRIKSNGHALSKQRAARIQREIDPFVVELSLHGASAGTHDRQTRVDGSFERLMTHIREMLEIGLRLKLNCTLTAWNEHELEQMFTLADQLGVRLQVDPQVTAKDDGDKGPLVIRASNQALSHLFELQRKRAVAAREPAGSQFETIHLNPPGSAAEQSSAEKINRHCGAGVATLTIDPHGNVYPCVQWRRKVGNLHDSRVTEIWRGSGELSAVRNKNVEVKQFVDGLGSAGRKIGFCPGLAEELTGSPLKLYLAAEAFLTLQHP